LNYNPLRSLAYSQDSKTRPPVDRKQIIIMPDNTSQIRGALLEELLLHLLRKSGYRVVSEVGLDTTLESHRGSLCVKGRGGRHQIDAIADFLISHPFSNPQRLLLEAKCYVDQSKVGIEIVRNAVGVLKDVCEYWIPIGNPHIAKSRFHYQYALFSTSPYTKETEDYAFAHDIYLIPLARSTFLKPAIDIIRRIGAQDFQRGVEVGEIRRSIRDWFKTGDYPLLLERSPGAQRKLRSLYDVGSRINFSLLAVLGRSFPVFLVPGPDVVLNDLESQIEVQIFWNEVGWYLRRPNGELLFSFDLPPELFSLYAIDGRLEPHRALELKAAELGEIMAYATDQERIRVIQFNLDQNWLGEVSRRVHRQRDQIL
jgi:hypothetical protein